MHGSGSFVTTNIVGGLGNQLFLVANLLATSKRNGIASFLPRVSLSSSCEAPRPTYWSSLFVDLLALGVAEEAPQHLPVVRVPESRPAAPVWLDPSTPKVYDMVGFFQSELYFRDYPVIKGVVPQSLTAAAAEHMRANYGIRQDTHTVALHLRRGDYVRMKHVFEELPLSYYDAALRQLLGGLLLRDIMCAYDEKGHHVKVLVFCEEELFGNTAVGYFASKYEGLDVVLVHAKNEAHPPLPGGASSPREVLELLMIHLCNDVVMANSTFSWWGAYLNEKPLRRVVAPSKWFVQDPYPLSNHMYCDDWILL